MAAFHAEWNRADCFKQFRNKLQAPQFPNVTTTFQRLEANAKYVVDPDLIRSLGWKGEVALRFRYTGEHNPRDQLEQRFMQPYMYETLNQSQVAYYQAPAWNNHNQNVHMIGGDRLGVVITMRRRMVSSSRCAV